MKGETSVFKSAYIIRADGINEADCRRNYRTETSISLVAGVDNERSAIRLITELIEEGYEQIDLGYGFSERDALHILGSIDFQKAAGGRVKLHAAAYTINEYAKFRNAGRMRSHGIIMAIPGADRAAALFIPDKVHDTRVVFVKNITQAKHAARYLVKHKVGFIELCTWFDRLRMEEVISAIGGAVPVGTCGDLTMQELEPEMDRDGLMPEKRVYKRRKRSGSEPG